jgi:tripartite-type tricarboxylate transporter receptor subunit TctC
MATTKTSLSLFAAALTAVALAHAQTYPERPIRVVDAYSPGGTSDLLGRILGQKFQELEGQPWILENRTGANGIIGSEFVAKAQPNGYTLLMLTTTLTVQPSIYRNLPYDVLKSFAPVIQVSAAANILVLHPAIPAKSVKDLIALARAKPGQLTYASGGAGTSTHMSMELFKSMAKLDIRHIPYKGITPGIVDIIGGHVDCAFSTMPVALPYIRSGKLHALAVTSATRALAAPEIPTVAESGLAGFEAANAVGVLAPAGTPREIVDKLNAVIARILNLADVRERFAVAGVEPVGGSPGNFENYIRTEIRKWAGVVKSSGMEVQAW